MSFVEGLLRRSHTWALIDDLAMNVVAPMLLTTPNAQQIRAMWSEDGDFWVRRTAMLALLPRLRRDLDSWHEFAGYADAMLVESEFFIQKAIGWVLREVSKHSPDLVFEWMQPRVAIVVVGYVSRGDEVSARRTAFAANRTQKASAAGEEELKRPNVLFIMADQLKWSALRMYSEIGIPTPSLERLAARGVMYRNAMTPHPLCVPARTSIMTGRYPHTTGCRRNETLMPDNETHAFQIWRDAGYTTGLIGKNHCFIDLDVFDVYCDISHGGLPKGDYLGSEPETKGMEWVRPIEAINKAHEARARVE